MKFLRILLVSLLSILSVTENQALDNLYSHPLSVSSVVKYTAKTDGNAGVCTKQGVGGSPATKASNTGINPYLGRPKASLLKSKASYEKLIKSHKQKIIDFKKDPISNTAPDKLKEMMIDNPSYEVLYKRALGRVPALESQINKQKAGLKKVIEALDQLE